MLPMARSYPCSFIKPYDTKNTLELELDETILVYHILVIFWNTESIDLSG